MKWHDCKTDPPKTNGRYVLVYKYTPDDSLDWDCAYYDSVTNLWEDSREFGFAYKGKYEPIKWTEVNLNEED